MLAADREGQFRAEIFEYGLREEGAAQSMAVFLKVRLLQLYDATEDLWNDWEPYQMEAEGKVWIIKKDGTLNDSAVQSLIKHAGWDGDIAGIAVQSWKPTPCQVAVGADTYKGVTRYRINFVNGWDDKPGLATNVTPDKAKALQQRYGASLRAIAGNARRNGAAPHGAPPIPSPPPAKTPPPLPPSAAASTPGYEDVPF